MERFWVYLDNKVQGPVEIPSLRKLFGFNLLTQVCAEGEETWRMADDVIEIKAYFSAPPRGSSLIPDGQPDLLTPKTQIEMPMPASALGVVETLPPSHSKQNNPDVETLPGIPMPVGNTVPQAAVVGSESLRISCVTCGYKNPRDVGVCMKCGSPLKAGAATEDKPKISLNALMDSSPSMAAPAPIAGGIPIPTEPVKVESPMVEIPVKRIAIIVVSLAAVGGLFIAGQHFWKLRHRAKVALHPVVIQPDQENTDSSKQTPTKATRSSRKATRAKAAVLPGVSPEPIPAPTTLPPAKTEANKQEPASYTVVKEAYPLQHRTSSPIDSKYAVKRRGDRGLWSSREEQAIQQVQNQRIYGGRRTIRRNADILMQILRDREYTTAFETGKRLFLFNDADWAASQAEGPIFEVRLTFSGGKEVDGSSRAPLRFAFRTDLERQTVEPGSSGMVKANTMHAFFDESRIPPEERRDVAKDTEELVKAAQPGESPLALETVSRQYANTYSLAALTRIAQAYGLNLVNKKLARETASVTDVIPEARSAKNSESKEAKPAPTPAKEAKALPPSLSGQIQYQIERGTGKERMVTARVPSKAVPSRLWETLTSYDRFTQFVPDMLVSQREGQDGPAIIVHTVSLTRLMVFVFKLNLHLRILEHPQQRRLEFERIAGDFEKFSGYAEIVPDATGTRTSLDLHLTFVPKGYAPNWAIEGMARHFLVPVLDAIRSKAEAN